MGVYDQAARFATQLNPEPVLRRLSAARPVALSFREWFDTRTLPVPGGTDRTADLIAALEDPTAPDSPWLVVFEFQAQPDADKLDTTLDIVGTLRTTVRHGDDRKGKYRVVVAMVYLQGRSAETVLDMELSPGVGTRHAPFFWNVAEDDAVAAIEQVEVGIRSWSELFWVPLMNGGDDEAVVVRWRDVMMRMVAERDVRDAMVTVAFVFAELVRRNRTWERVMSEFAMTESPLVNSWIERGIARGELRTQRQYLLELLEDRFPGMVPADVVRLVAEQEDRDLLHDWFRAAGRAADFGQFLAYLKR